MWDHDAESIFKIVAFLAKVNSDEFRFICPEFGSHFTDLEIFNMFCQFRKLIH